MVCKIFSACKASSNGGYTGSRAYVLYCSMVAPFDNAHIRVNIPRLEEAIKHGDSAGDR